jgi:hypothetical protein
MGLAGASPASGASTLLTSHSPAATSPLPPTAGTATATATAASAAAAGHYSCGNSTSTTTTATAAATERRPQAMQLETSPLLQTYKGIESGGGMLPLKLESPGWGGDYSTRNRNPARYVSLLFTITTLEGIVSKVLAIWCRLLQFRYCICTQVLMHMQIAARTAAATASAAVPFLHHTTPPCTTSCHTNTT